MSYNSPFSGAEVDDAVTKRHEKNKDTKLDEGGANETTAQETRAHIDATDNPHGVTKTQVGLGDVDNVSAADLRDRSTHTGTQTLSTISDAGTIASQDANSVNIDGGTIDGTAVNATTLTASVDGNLIASKINLSATSSNTEVLPTSFPHLELDRASSFNGSFLKFSNNRAGFAGIGSAASADNAHYLTLHSGTGGERMRIDSSGHAIIPAGVTLGTSAGVYNAANTLDDYEEGTFTPVLTGSVSGTFNGFGRYVKIGKQVTVYIAYRLLTTANKPIGNYTIENLPFLSNSSLQVENTGMSYSGFARVTFNPNRFFSWFVAQGTTRILMREAVSNDRETTLNDSNFVSSGDMYFRATSTYEVN